MGDACVTSGHTHNYNRLSLQPYPCFGSGILTRFRFNRLVHTVRTACLSNRVTLLVAEFEIKALGSVVQKQDGSIQPARRLHSIWVHPKFHLPLQTLLA